MSLSEALAYLLTNRELREAFGAEGGMTAAALGVTEGDRPAFLALESGALDWHANEITRLRIRKRHGASPQRGLLDDADLLGIDRDFLEANVTTLMGNVIFGYPFGGTNGNFAPYVVGGIGLLRIKADVNDELFSDVDSSNNEFGMDLGGGVMGFVNDSWGFRGDVRWFYSFDRPELDFDLLDVGITNRVDVPTVDLIDINLDRHFWRATGGVTFRW